MDLGFIRLIEEHREDLWTSLGDYSKVFTQAGAVSRASLTHGSAGTKGPVDHLAYLKERHGEKIVAVDISLVPEPTRTAFCEVRAPLESDLFASIALLIPSRGSLPCPPAPSSPPALPRSDREELCVGFPLCKDRETHIPCAPRYWNSESASVR